MIALLPGVGYLFSAQFTVLRLDRHGDVLNGSTCWRETLLVGGQ